MTDRPADPPPTAPTPSGVRDLAWSIAEVAAEFGVTHRAVRFYESQGLISPERRGTRRLYQPRDRVRLGLILRGKRLGFDLAEIRRIVDMYDQPPGEAGQLRYLLDQIAQRRGQLEQRRRDIALTLTELGDLEQRCRIALDEVDPAPAPDPHPQLEPGPAPHRESEPDPASIRTARSG